jgi:ABC-type Fe2+-enterobactin transport system substrate-binding protein
VNDLRILLARPLNDRRLTVQILIVLVDPHLERLLRDAPDLVVIRTVRNDVAREVEKIIAVIITMILQHTRAANRQRVRPCEVGRVCGQEGRVRGRCVIGRTILYRSIIRRRISACLSILSYGTTGIAL